jgi:hypothetical protein
MRKSYEAKLAFYEQQVNTLRKLVESDTSVDEKRRKGELEELAFLKERLNVYKQTVGSQRGVIMELERKNTELTACIGTTDKSDGGDGSNLTDVLKSEVKDLVEKLRVERMKTKDVTESGHRQIASMEKKLSSMRIMLESETALSEKRRIELEKLSSKPLVDSKTEITSDASKSHRDSIRIVELEGKLTALTALSLKDGEEISALKSRLKEQIKFNQEIEARLVLEQELALKNQKTPETYESSVTLKDIEEISSLTTKLQISIQANEDLESRLAQLIESHKLERAVDLEKIVDLETRLKSQGETTELIQSDFSSSLAVESDKNADLEKEIIRLSSSVDESQEVNTHLKITLEELQQEVESRKSQLDRFIEVLWFIKSALSRSATKAVTNGTDAIPDLPPKFDEELLSFWEDEFNKIKSLALEYSAKLKHLEELIISKDATLESLNQKLSDVEHEMQLSISSKSTVKNVSDAFNAVSLFLVSCVIFVAAIVDPKKAELEKLKSDSEAKESELSKQLDSLKELLKTSTDAENGLQLQLAEIFCGLKSSDVVRAADAEMKHLEKLALEKQIKSLEESVKARESEFSEIHTTLKYKVIHLESLLESITYENESLKIQSSERLADWYQKLDQQSAHFLIIRKNLEGQIDSLQTLLGSTSKELSSAQSISSEKISELEEAYSFLLKDHEILKIESSERLSEWSLKLHQQSELISRLREDQTNSLEDQRNSYELQLLQLKNLVEIKEADLQNLLAEASKQTDSLSFKLNEIEELVINFFLKLLSALLIYIMQKSRYELDLKMAEDKLLDSKTELDVKNQEISELLLKHTVSVEKFEREISSLKESNKSLVGLNFSPFLKKKTLFIYQKKFRKRPSSQNWYSPSLKSIYFRKKLSWLKNP